MTPQEMDALIMHSAQQHNIPPDMLRRMFMVESNMNPNAVNPRTGAAGIGQFMPGTAKELGIDPMNPRQAIPASAMYLRQNFNRFGDWDKATAAYNWGPGNVARHGLDNMPPETRSYVARVVGGGGGPQQPFVAQAPAPVPAQSSLSSLVAQAPQQQRPMPMPDPTGLIISPLLAQLQKISQQSQQQQLV